MKNKQNMHDRKIGLECVVLCQEQEATTTNNGTKFQQIHKTCIIQRANAQFIIYCVRGCYSTLSPKNSLHRFLSSWHLKIFTYATSSPHIIVCAKPTHRIYRTNSMRYTNRTDSLCFTYLMQKFLWAVPMPIQHFHFFFKPTK